jgi:anti-sigma regulatory factor (Ser/Thr protein kinase)
VLSHPRKSQVRGSGDGYDRGIVKTFEFRLPAEPTAAAVARGIVEAVGSDLPESILIDAKLLTTEVVTNAIRHARGTQVVVMRIRRNNLVRVEVVDQGPMFDPQPQTTSARAGGGQGLVIVGAVANAWGVEPDEAGKKVWFELAAGGGDDISV